MIKEVNDNSFNDEVSNYDKPVVVDFWAPWCGPCRMLAPVMEELEKELGSEVKFVKVNVDDNPVLSQKYRVSSIPTVMVFNKGMTVDTIVGFRPKQAIKQAIQNHI